QRTRQFPQRTYRKGSCGVPAQNHQPSGETGRIQTHWSRYGSGQPKTDHYRNFQSIIDYFTDFVRWHFRSRGSPSFHWRLWCDSG
ncbi:hypothetical protein PFISCL1PPCAC_12007, partial [Pristionchus fissidentatus]